MHKLFCSRSCVSCRVDRAALSVIVCNSLLSLMICLCLACASRSDADAPCPTIEMSAVANTEADSIRTVILNDSPKILVATGDISGATASRKSGEDQWAFEFTVTDAAAARVREFSKQHIGSNLALAVDGKVHGAPRIVGAISGNRYRIEGLSRADAERLTAAISKGCRQ